MNFKKLDDFMQKMPERGYPGCELAVAKDGEIVYRTGVGYADAAKTRPVSHRDLYWIFSATKVITCIAAMRLVEEGKLSLDDPVYKYVPEFKNVKVKQADGTLAPAKNEMTVLHLFTMTGGLSYDLKQKELLEARTPNASTLDVVRAMAKLPLDFEPGTHFQYSLCHDVLAGVVEVVSGMRFLDYLDMLIFKPIGIKDMGFFPNEEQKSRFVSMYTYNTGFYTATEIPLQNKYTLTPNYDSGGAGLFASVDEYIKIIAVIANGGATKDGYRILRPETIDMMTKNRLCDDALTDFISTHKRLYGYGWGLCGRAHMNDTVSLAKSPVGEFGWDGAANAYVMIDPFNRVAIYFGTEIMNCGYGYRVIHTAIRDLVYEGLEE
ncbi:MAG: beta-lactamase family protein [Clostridia bacterium]|nr:beta-lactamase family protein [Clostridia bacterium]